MFKNRKKHGSDEGMQFITEPRGGYDAWSDGWRHIIEVILPDGESRGDKVFDEEFETDDGIPIEVEVPSCLQNDIWIEQYEPEYDYECMSLREFNNRLESGEIRQINTNE